MNDKAYLTVEEFAKLLGYSKTTVYAKIKKGKVQALRISDEPNGSLRIPSDECQRICSRQMAKKIKETYEKDHEEKVP